MKTFITLAIAIFLMCRCTRDRANRRESFSATVSEVQATGVRIENPAAPKVIPAGKPKVIRASKPKVFPVTNNVRPAGIPTIIPARSPEIYTPGRNGLLLPKTVLASDSPILAGPPEVVIARESVSRNQNSQNFSSFGLTEGLKSDVVLCALQDAQGNLWFGTQRGGVTKYDGNSFFHFTEKQGLKNNSIRSILQDSRGNIWFGMGEGGLTKYDGKTFTHFTEKDSLGNSAILCITEDKDGNVWFGNQDGLSKFDGTSFTHFTKKEGLMNDTVLSILQDKRGYLWIGTGRGLCKYEEGTFAHFTQSRDLANSPVHDIEQDSLGVIWFATRQGVFAYDGKNFEHFTTKQGLLHDGVTCLWKDIQGNIWFGGDGVSKFDGKKFKYFTEKEGLTSNIVFDILGDRHGNHWFATGVGISKLASETFSHFTRTEGLVENIVLSIVEDRTGNLWLGTFNNGVIKYDGRSFQHFTEDQGLLNKNIWTMLEDKQGNLWLGTYFGVIKFDRNSFVYYTKEEGLINDDVKSIMQDKMGNLWFGTSAGASMFDSKNFTNFSEESLGIDNVMTILEDSDGHFWFGGYKGGATRFDGEKFTNFKKGDGLAHDNIRHIVQDKNGNLWFGSADGGVSKYNGKTFTTFNETHGLSNDRITSMLVDKTGNLWIGTARGLNKLGKDKLISDKRRPGKLADHSIITGASETDIADTDILFRTFTHEDAFTGIGVNTGKAICEAKDGRLWLGANDRLTTFHPGKEIFDTIAPNIQLTDITLFNEKIPWPNLISYQTDSSRRTAVKDTGIVLGNGVLVDEFNFTDLSKWYGIPEQLSLRANNNYLTFQFVGITLRSPGKVRYRYKLEGLDKNWSALTNRTEAPYGNLPHGKYTFKVKAMNGDGYWSKEFHYSFTIRPPWWHTWWAYTLFALLFAGFIYALFRYRLNKLRTQHEMVVQKQKASELEMQALRSQMNPHFIFNSLNAINMFILENNKLQASDYLSKFSKLIRLILQNSQEAFIPLERELEALRLYLDLETLRFEQKFDYTITVDEEIPVSVKIPPLLIQPYAENAVWHGLMHKKENGHLAIDLYMQEEILCCRIADDGIGRKKAAELKSKSASVNKSMGMRITASRIERLQKDQNDFSILVTDLVLPDGAPGGTEVLLKIPVQS